MVRLQFPCTGVIVLFFTVLGIANAATYIVDDDPGSWRDFPSIQEAIDGSSDNDIILVFEGWYDENVSVNTEIDIVGNGSLSTVINGTGMGHAVYVKADNVTLRNVTIHNSGSNRTDAGLYLKSNNSIISNIYCVNNTVGLNVTGTNITIQYSNISSNSRDGIRLDNATNCNISFNDIQFNGRNGIECISTMNIDVYNNDINNDSKAGIAFSYSSNMSVIHNTIMFHILSVAIVITDSSFSGIFNDNIVIYNRAGFSIWRVNGRDSGFHLYNNVVSHNDRDGIYITRVTDFTINHNTCNWNGRSGIVQGGSKDVIVSENILNNNGWSGFKSATCTNITIIDNYIANNTGYGIETSSDLIAINNTLINNSFRPTQFYVTGRYLDLILEPSNTIDGKPIIFWKNKNGGLIPSNASFIFLLNCSNITIRDQDNSHGGIGIFILNCSDISIVDVRCSNSEYGLMIIKSRNVTINKCTFSNNTESYYPEYSYGIYLKGNNNTQITYCQLIRNDIGLYIASFNDSLEKNIFIHYNDIMNNGVYGLFSHCRLTINASYNWWGNATGPYHKEKNPNGTGDIIKDNNNGVLIIPWLPYAEIIQIIPNPVKVGNPVLFKGAGASKFGNISYVWVSNIDDEIYNGTESSFERSNLTNGTHQITLSVMDDYGLVSNDTSILIVNIPPNASILSITPNPSTEYSNVTFNGEGIDSDGSILQYNWRSSIDGEFYNGSSNQTNYSSLSPGNHTIFFKVMDNHGAWGEEAISSLDINDIPIAIIKSIFPDYPLDGDLVQFTANGTDDGRIVQYSWRSDVDGLLYNGSSSEFSMTNLTNETHRISLMVKDNHGVWSDEVQTYLTVNGRPVANISSMSPNPALETEIVTFVSNSIDDDEIILYVWRSDLDGEFYNGTDSTIELSNLSNGTHKVYLKVQDNDGVWSSEVSKNLIINGVPRASTISMSPSPAIEGDVINFTASAYDDGFITIFEWSSDIDGVLYNGSLTTFFTSLSNGSHNISLRVQDNDGAWSDYSNDTIAVNGLPRARIVLITPDPAINGNVVNFNGTGIDENNIVRYIWNSSLDGTLYNGLDDSFITSTLQNGTHVITLVVQDDQGLWSYNANATLNVTTIPQATIVSISPDPALQDENVTFSAKVIDDGGPHRFLWDSDLDGELYIGLSSTVDINYLSNGTHNITLTVQDEFGFWSPEVNGTLHVSGRPIAKIQSISPDPGLETSTIAFQGHGIDDNLIVQYMWFSSKDGFLVNGSESNLTINGLSTGNHTITLRVQDSYGFWSHNDTMYLYINIRPTVQLIKPKDDSTISGITRIYGTSIDIDDVIEFVEISINNESWQLVNGTSEWFFEWDTTTEKDGMISIRIRSYDGMHYSLIEEVKVDVDNQSDDADDIPMLILGIVIGLIVLVIVFIVYMKKFR